MSKYNQFVKEAIADYQKLPQETSELYKRHYINIPFDLASIAKSNQANDSGIEKELSGINVKFDLVMGSSSFRVERENEFISVVDAEELSDEFIANVLHKSGEDKYVAQIYSNARKFVFIDVPEGREASINILASCSNSPLSTVVQVKVGERAKLNVFEYYGSDSESLSDIGIIHEVYAKPGSEIEINALHNENAKTLCLSYFRNVSEKESHIKLNSLYLGSAQTRVRNCVEANEAHSKVTVNEIIFGSSDQKFDIGTYIINSAPHTNAVLESKAALMDSSFCIMKGFAKINKGAEKAKSYVHERGILLDKAARVYGLPDMSVDENDVKATHSSATAPVDEEAVFYLMTKGIDETGVRKLLVTGFLVESISKIGNNLMKELSMSLINSKLETKIYGVVPRMDMKNIWVSSGPKDLDIFKGHYKYRGNE